MRARELDITGAWEITPQLHPDSRGLFFEWLTARGFSVFAGHRLDVRQANCSVSAAGVLRGLHFAPQREHTICATDPAHAINWPSGHELVLSDRDAAAATLDEVRATGLLPTWEEARS